jgi:hypothetical protein
VYICKARTYLCKARAYLCTDGTLSRFDEDGLSPLPSLTRFEALLLLCKALLLVLLCKTLLAYASFHTRELLIYLKNKPTHAARFITVM